MLRHATAAWGRVLLAGLVLAGMDAGAQERTPAAALASLAPDAMQGSVLPHGKVTAVAFWATWCAPRALADLRLLEREFGARGLVALAINLDEDESAARAYGVGNPMPGTSLLDPAGATARAFGVAAMPAIYLVDCEGRIRSKHHGRRMPGLRAAVAGLLAERCPGHT